VFAEEIKVPQREGCSAFGALPRARPDTIRRYRTHSRFSEGGTCCWWGGGSGPMTRGCRKRARRGQPGDLFRILLRLKVRSRAGRRAPPANWRRARSFLRRLGRAAGHHVGAMTWGRLLEAPRRRPHPWTLSSFPRRSSAAGHVFSAGPPACFSRASRSLSIRVRSSRRDLRLSDTLLLPRAPSRLAANVPTPASGSPDSCCGAAHPLSVASGRHPGGDRGGVPALILKGTPRRMRSPGQGGLQRALADSPWCRGGETRRATSRFDAAVLGALGPSTR